MSINFMVPESWIKLPGLGPGKKNKREKGIDFLMTKPGDFPSPDLAQIKIFIRKGAFCFWLGYMV